MRRIARNADPDQIAAADDAVGRVVLDPPGAGKKDLDPGMGRPATDEPVAAIDEGVVIEIAGDELCRDAEAAACLHHQEREVAAAA